MGQGKPGSFGLAVTRERERRKWTKGELARRSGVSSSYIVRLENGYIQSPTMEQAAMIAKAFDLTTDGLLGTPRTSSEGPNILILGPVVLVPVVNISLAAGSAVFGETNEAFPVPEYLAQGRRLLAARVTGNCMEPEVRQGDTAVIDISDMDPRPGDLVAVLLEDGGMAIKRFELPNGEALLTDNKGESYKPNGAKMQGVVVYVGRPYRRN